MYVASTMRISDSLKDNTSYFYAELQRLKQIKEKLVSGIPCFILLDEILKGTNSNDKQKGSKAFVEKLLHYPCLGIVATHDLELGVLQSQYPGQVKNFCFESFIQNNELTFDYKIREGLAQNTNASYLMKELGII
jgi:DNA mismatch repair ATPase MutS